MCGVRWLVRLHISLSTATQVLRLFCIEAISVLRIVILWIMALILTASSFEMQGLTIGSRVCYSSSRVC